MAQDMDDHIQEVFLTAHRLGGYRPGPARPTSWLAAIAARVASTRKRSLRRRREAPSSIVVGTAADPTQNPARSAEANESVARVMRALDSLALSYRTVFVLYELEGESGAEIAAALGIAENTVYSRLHRARRQFLTAYEELRAGDATPRAAGGGT